MAAERRPKRRDRRGEERPEAPWGSFPLQELTVLVGLVILIVGAVTQNPKLLVVGVALGCLGGLELVVREHLAGYRSHTVLIAGVGFVFVVAGLFYYAGLILLVCLIIGAVVFAGMAWWMRSVFKRASGGLTFKA